MQEPQRQKAPACRPRANHGSGLLRWGLIACLVAGIPTAALPAEPTVGAPPVSGLVLDPLGQALQGVMILVSNDRFASSLAAAVSDGNGRFDLPDLPPGHYQVAASKAGYQVQVTSLDTLLRRSVDLVLRPLTAAGNPGTRPSAGGGTLEWILRVPTVDVLRDLERPTVTADRSGGNPGAGETPVRDAPALSRVRGEVVHMQLGSGPFAAPETAVEASGRSSQVRMRGEVSELLEWHFLGDLRRLTRMRESDAEAAASGHEFNSRAMSMGVDFNPTSEDDLSMSLLFGSTRFLGEEGFQGPLPPRNEQEQKTWGYDARWSRILDPLSNLDVRLSFLQGQVAAGDPGARPLGAQDDAGAALDHALWDAGGTYSLALDDSHNVLVGMRTRLYRGDSSGAAGVVMAVPGLAIPAGAELQEGWDLDLFGQDQWVLSEPFEIISSLAYSRSDEVRGEEFVIPKVIFQHSLEDGTVWNAGLLVAWAPRGPDGAVSDAAAKDARLGYQVGLRRPLPQGFHLAVSAASHPARGFNSLFEEEGAFLNAPAVAADGLYLAHRRVETRELDLQVEKRFRHAIGRLGSTIGEAEGRLAAGWDEFSPVVQLNEASMRYLVTRLETVFPRFDTEFQIGFRKLSEQSGINLSDFGVFRSYSVVDFLVAQRLAFLENLSRSEWRVVVAFQDVTTEAAADRSSDLLLDPDNTYSRLSGGIEVRF